MPISDGALHVIGVLYQHRLVTTSQVREIVLPGRRARRGQQVLAELAGRGLAASVPVRSALAHLGERAWHITEQGAELAEAVGTRAESRRRVLTPVLAGSHLQAHTLAVNDVGLAFLRAARERHHGFGPESWRHEIAHDLRATPRQPHDLLIADAVLKYWCVRDDERPLPRYRFLELDRATLMMDDLASKLVRYARLHQRWTEFQMPFAAGPRPPWAVEYRAFPRVMVMFANRERADLRMRINTVRALCRSDPELRNTPGVVISLALLDDLMARGPFAPVFQQVEHDEWVNWLGEAGA